MPAGGIGLQKDPDGHGQGPGGRGPVLEPGGKTPHTYSVGLLSSCLVCKGRPGKIGKRSEFWEVLRFSFVKTFCWVTLPLVDGRDSIVCHRDIMKSANGINREGSPRNTSSLPGELWSM